MKKNEMMILMLASCASICSVGAATLFGSTSSFGGKADSTVYSMTISSTNKIGGIAVSDTDLISGSGNVKTEIGNDIGLSFENVYNAGGAFLKFANGGTLSNTNALRGLKSITVVSSTSGWSFDVYCSVNSAIPNAVYATIDSEHPTVSFDTYSISRFKFVSKAEGIVVDSIGFDYECSMFSTRKTLLYGEYPQSDVTNTSVGAELNASMGDLPTSSNPGAWTSYNYYVESAISDCMWYMDVELSGSKYRGVYLNAYRPINTFDTSDEDGSYQVDNGYTPGNVYWFKFEPIVWRMLEEGDNGAKVLSDKILDSQHYYRFSDYKTERTRSPYDSSETESVYDNNYKFSDIRGWLNTSFSSASFSAAEETLVATTLVDNSASSTNNSTNAYACENANDKIFLLSYQEAYNSSYGFNSDASRKAYATDYAKCQGTYVDSSYGTSYWSLRSPHSNASHSSSSIVSSGDYTNGWTEKTDRGIRPALTINLD